MKISYQCPKSREYSTFSKRPDIGELSWWILIPRELVSHARMHLATLLFNLLDIRKGKVYNCNIFLLPNCWFYSSEFSFHRASSTCVYVLVHPYFIASYKNGADTYVGTPRLGNSFVKVNRSRARNVKLYRTIRLFILWELRKSVTYFPPERQNSKFLNKLWYKFL